MPANYPNPLTPFVISIAHNPVIRVFLNCHNLPMALLDFFKNLKAKRAAKAAKKKYEVELAEWQSETEILTQALEIL